MQHIPPERILTLSNKPINPNGLFIIYWMAAVRRPTWNFALDRALLLADKLNKQMLVVECLYHDEPWSNLRHHTFIMQGMHDNASYFKEKGIAYYPYLDTHESTSLSLLAALSKHACAIVTDDYPYDFIVNMQQQLAHVCDVLYEAVDSNGILPMRLSKDVFPTAYALRRYLQKNIAKHIVHMPQAEPCYKSSTADISIIPRSIVDNFPICDTVSLPSSIDNSVTAGIFKGGFKAAGSQSALFLNKRLSRYGLWRSHPDENVASELSAYLHHGHISVHTIFKYIADAENWDPSLLHTSPTKGQREGFWHMQPSTEAFLDELITWREIGFNMCVNRRDYALYSSLPEWAQATLQAHMHDPKPFIYTQAQLESAHTHDAVWNAAQYQLLTEGRIQNYLRMLWGKKILEWSATPQEALATMIHLNNKYALDGRDPNSYSGIFWVLGRYDRPWPKRPIFGAIRYMSSDNTVRKLRMQDYLQRYGKQQQLRLF